MRGRIREWIITILTVILVSSLVYAHNTNEKLKVELERVDSLQVVADSISTETASRLSTQRQEILDSIAAIPPIVVSDVVYRWRTVTDTITLPPEIITIGSELTERVEILEAGIAQRDSLISRIPALLAQRDSIWTERLMAVEAVNIQLREALEVKTSGSGFWRDAKVSLISAAVGATACYFLCPRETEVKVAVGDYNERHHY